MRQREPLSVGGDRGQRGGHAGPVRVPGDAERAPAPGRGGSRRASISTGSLAGSAQRGRRDDVRRGGRGDLTGRGTADTVGDEHAGGPHEPGVLVAAAHETHVAERDAGEAQHPDHPLSWSNAFRPSHGSRAGVPRSAEAAPDTMGAWNGCCSGSPWPWCSPAGSSARPSTASWRSTGPPSRRRPSEGDRQAQGVRTALRSLSTQLSGAQVGVTLTNLVIGFLAEPAIAKLLETPLSSARRARRAPCPASRSRSAWCWPPSRR